MGEEKKPEEMKAEEKKPEEEVKKPAEEEKKKEEEAKKPAEDEKKPEEEKKEEPKEPPPPPPEEVVLKVFMHCEGCARKVKRCLKGFEGVEDVHTDCKTHTVIVKGKVAAADPLKVLARVQRKSHRQVELISPIPKPPSEEEKKAEEEAKKANAAKPEEKKEEPPVIIVVLQVHMHCEACAQEIQKRIQRMKGVQTAEADLKSSQVTVKGVFDPLKLVEYVYKRTGKHAAIIKTEPEKKEEEKGKEEKEEKKEEKEEKEKGAEKGGEGGGEKKEGEEAAKPAAEEAKPAAAEAAIAAEEEAKVETMEVKRNEYYYHPPRYPVEYVYPPQIFSDENPNACSVM